MIDRISLTTSPLKWQNRLLWLSSVGLLIWVVAFLGHWICFRQDGWGYGILVMVPVLLFITPMHLLLTGLTAYRWAEWSDKRKRVLTLVCSLSVPASLFLIISLRLF